jgi:hypothetical protein
MFVNPNTLMSGTTDQAKKSIQQALITSQSFGYNAGSSFELSRSALSSKSMMITMGIAVFVHTNT